jgi:hypothetical protein
VSGCRSAAMLGGPSVCDAPVLEGEDAAEVGVTPGRWGRRHGEVLGSATATIRRDGPVKAKPIKPRAAAPPTTNAALSPASAWPSARRQSRRSSTAQRRTRSRSGT